MVKEVSLEVALISCFDVQPPPPLNIGTVGEATSLSDIVKQNRGRVIVVFPEATTSNGRSILKLAPSLLSAPKETRIFPVSLRYTPPDVVTPIPGWVEMIKFIWRLNSRPTHCIRVRIGAPVNFNSAPQSTASPDNRSRAKVSGRASNGAVRDGYDTNYFDTLDSTPSRKVSGDTDTDEQDDMSEAERRLLDVVAETLARLGRVKRVGLGVEEKKGFIDAWNRRGKYRT